VQGLAINISSLPFGNLGQYLEFRQSTYARYWINFIRLDDFLVVGIMLAKCKIQHFTNHWSSVNQQNVGPI